VKTALQGLNRDSKLFIAYLPLQGEKLKTWLVLFGNDPNFRIDISKWKGILK